jgi:GWxTD domain-containing protein
VIPAHFPFRKTLTLLILVVWGIVVPGQTSSPDGGAQERAQSETIFYDRWISEDVRWIITDEELASWKTLKSNAERDLFIDAFWRRRDPTPDTGENEYKDEHYRRIMYANGQFAAGVPGWRSDRGRMYIMYGKPDSIDAYPKGGPHPHSGAQGGSQTLAYPFEVWHYRYLEGIGQDIEIAFADPCACGEYHMALDPSKEGVPLPVTNANNQSKQFDRLELGGFKAAPKVKFTDLEAVVNTKIRYNLLPLGVRVDFVKVTSDTVLVPITVQVPNRALTFANQDGVQRATFNIYGRMSTLTGKITQTFEEARRLDVPAELLDKFVNNITLYWKALPMRPGRYRLDVVVKDVNGDKLGTFGQSVMVLDYKEGKLASSTLILADVMEPVSSREVGSSDFVLGAMKVRPKVPPSGGEPVRFKRDRNQKINFWMQVYNLAIDEKTKRPAATVEYQVVNTSTKQPVLDFTETTDQMGNLGDLLTLHKSLPAGNLNPGMYQVAIKVNDSISKQTISPTALFAVE